MNPIEDQQRNPQPYQAIGQEFAGTFAVVGTGREVTRDEEEQPHRERLPDTIVHRQDQTENKSGWGTSL